jgi:hypothetical protein
MSEAVSTAAYDWSLGSDDEDEDAMRERMVSLRATSAPLRSSAGCGSYVCILI